MLKLYICEDIEVQRNRMQQVIENMILMEELDMEFGCVSEDPHRILDTVKETGEVGIYFLDIALGADMTGLTLAQEIRKYDPRGFIIFVTTHSEMSYMTFIYKLEAMDFILKDDPEELERRMCECILKASQRFASVNNKVHANFSVKVNEKVFTVDYDEILFFETSPNVHKIILHCKNRQMEFLGKIKEIEKEVDGRFYRCHRSFLVNRDNIREIDFQNRVIYMVNGDECLISSRMMKGLK
ncbi:MAG: response regulator transcription factor [Lachnospiraceae bacterium]|jgi:two-component system response regulator AgrA|nr:response regulator transcription factor [Lachnospiraceae bacterium]GFI30529.1 accessory gene regulator A [Lachnospiraceae bacterium]